MTKCQVCKCLIKNCECPGTAHLCKTCQERESLDEHEACTCCPNCGGSKIDNSCSCCSICSGSQETCNCCKVCGKPEDSCKGVATPANRSSASVSVPNASSTTANVAVTAETIPAHANNTADSVRRRRLTVSAVKSADNSSVTAARPASSSQQSVCVVQCAINRSMFAAKTAENRTVESAA